MEEKIIEMLEKLTGSDEIRDNMDIDLFEAGLIDSLGFIELLISIDKEFGIQIEPTEIERKDINTAKKISDYIISRKD